MSRPVHIEGGANFSTSSSPYKAIEVPFEGMMINVESGLVKVASRLRLFADGAFSMIDEPGVVCFVEVNDQPTTYSHGDNQAPVFEFSFQFIRMVDGVRHRDSYKGPQFTSYENYQDEQNGLYTLQVMSQYIENDHFHRLTGPANILLDPITHELSNGYYKEGYPVTDDVIESGYEDGSAELEMMMTLISVRGDSK